MKVYSDKLTREDLFGALPTDVYANVRDIPKVRVRTHGWDVSLKGLGARHTRSVNSGEYGAGYHKAASYDDHGEWMMRLFDIDPDARISWWKDRADFMRGTENKYALATA